MQEVITVVLWARTHYVLPVLDDLNNCVSVNKEKCVKRFKKGEKLYKQKLV